MSLIARFLDPKNDFAFKAAEWFSGNREPVSATQASKTVDVARLFGALAATLVGGDAQVGASAAGNAAQNNWLNHIEARQLSQAKEKLQACQSAQCRIDAQAEIKTIEARDKARTEALAAACNAPSSAACAEQRRQVTLAAASYIGQPDGLDPFGVISRERAESQTLATQYNLRSSNAGAYNTLAGAAQSVVGGVVGVVELAATIGLAAVGDPQAQAQLSNLAKGIGNSLLHPIDATETLIANTLAQANALEMQGRADEATQLLAKLFTDGMLTISGAGTVVAKISGRVVGNIGEVGVGANAAERSFAFNAIESPGPLASLPGKPATNFYGGKYNQTVLTDDLVLYRGGEAGKPLGQWFTREAPQSVAQIRIDSAVKPQWIDPKTGVLTGTSTIDTMYAVRIPKGTTIYEGPVGYQGGIYMGGSSANQIFVPTPWNIKGVQILNATPIR